MTGNNEAMTRFTSSLKLTGTGACGTRSAAKEATVMEMVECGNCHGTGEVICSTCEGLGEIYCKRCGGIGYIRNEDPGHMNFCAECKGKGKVICATCEKARSYTCKECDGSGMIATMASMSS